MDNHSPETDDELITNIKRPSLISLSSEDSRCSEDKSNIPDDYEPINYIGSSSTLKELPEEYDFKVPYPSNIKRYSLTICNESCSYMNKSNSMHDVSSLSAFIPLRRDSCMFSTETLQSNSIATTKSKDSGFQRSTSCTSLNTNSSKKYDHVQSKVKQYIQTIKQSEALRKMQKRMENNAYKVSRESLDSAETSPTEIPVSKTDLLNKVKELEEEIKEKDCVIEQLEKNHSELRLKYAAAETRIDDLRIRVSQNEDSMNSYISDEKVAELLMNDAKNSRRYSSNLSKKCLNKSQPEKRELQPIKKFCSNSVNLNETYPILSNTISKSSSCKYIREGNFELSKSASNIDKVGCNVVNDGLDLPYDKNSFAKVQHWQRSLVNLNRNADSMEVCYPEEVKEPSRFCCLYEESTPKKSRRYLKNKEVQKQYRKSYPVGCKCEKYKDKVKDEPTTAASGRRKLARSVSFANDDSMTSSIYDDGDSSSDSSMVFVPKHESYRNFRQRKLQEKSQKVRSRSPKWSEIKKAKSASNIHHVTSTNKRLIDNVSSYEHSCSERKHCSKTHKAKYRKLDDCSKVLSSCNALGRCRSAHICHEIEEKQLRCIAHSKSFDGCGRRCERKERYDSLECSCLTALEKLKIQEHNNLAKFAERTKKYSRKSQENNGLLVACKRYSLNKAYE